MDHILESTIHYHLATEYLLNKKGNIDLLAAMAEIEAIGMYDQRTRVDG